MIDFFKDLLLWVLGGGSLGATITYIFTFKSKNRIAQQEANMSEVKVEQERLELKNDQYEYLQKVLDKYIKDYHDLEVYFRNRMRELRDNMNNIILENTKAISDKCNEIAALKAQITYLKGLRCYDSLCPKRIKQNPEKSE